MIQNPLVKFKLLAQQQLGSEFDIIRGCSPQNQMWGFLVITISIPLVRKKFRKTNKKTYFGNSKLVQNLSKLTCPSPILDSFLYCLDPHGSNLTWLQKQKSSVKLLSQLGGPILHRGSGAIVWHLTELRKKLSTESTSPRSNRHWLHFIDTT